MTSVSQYVNVKTSATLTGCSSIKPMRKLELLAPAADKDVAMEAILHGADAVYMGASSHGAGKVRQIPSRILRKSFVLPINSAQRYMSL